MEADLVRCNPTLGVRKIKYPTVGHHRWTPDKIEQFKATPSRTSTGRRSAPTIHASGRPLRFEMAITPADFQRLRYLLPGADQARLEAMSACGEEPGGGRWHATCSPPSARHHWPNDDHEPKRGEHVHPESALPRCGLAGHVKRRDERLVGGLWLDCVDEVRAGREVLGLGRQTPEASVVAGPEVVEVLLGQHGAYAFE
jgi:hypothetical protein